MTWPFTPQARGVASPDPHIRPPLREQARDRHHWHPHPVLASVMDRVGQVRGNLQQHAAGGEALRSVARRRPHDRHGLGHPGLPGRADGDLGVLPTTPGPRSARSTGTSTRTATSPGKHREGQGTEDATGPNKGRDRGRRHHAPRDLRHRRTGRRDAAIISLLWDTGLRRSEVARLALDDLDLDRQVVLVRESKNGEWRTAFFTTATAKRLALYLRRRLAKHPEALWTGHCGALGSDGIRLMLARRSRAAGVSVSRRTSSDEDWLPGGSRRVALRLRS